MRAEARELKISQARHVINVLKEEIPRDVKRLRRERAKGNGQRTDGGAPYVLVSDALCLQSVPNYGDLATRVGCPTNTTLIASVWTNGTYTMAQVREVGEYNLQALGIGITKRNPTDMINEEAGARIAVRRALENWLRRRSDEG